MPRKPEGEKIKCTYFTWVLTRRNGFYQADGRTNPQSPGRHALGTDDREAALKALDRLDLCKAVELGLASPSLLNQEMTRRLGLAEGKELYLEHVNRPQVRGVYVRRPKNATERSSISSYHLYWLRAATIGINSVAGCLMHMQPTLRRRAIRMQRSTWNWLPFFRLEIG